MKIVSVVGARPQFVKYAALSKELVKSYQCVLIHTGQHYDYNMNKIFFNELDIPKPNYELNVGSSTHAYQTGDMMKGIEDILMKEQPDLVIIYGDTNSTLAGALATVKLHIKVAHVEAGLRVFDKSIPEEINRIVADYCSDYLFCPTQTAVDNLRCEGMAKGVYLTGDVMADALNSYMPIAEKLGILDILGLNPKQYIIVTIHRPSNTDIRQNIENIVNALVRLSEAGEIIVFPVHPRTLKMLYTYGLFNKIKENVKQIGPLGYLEFLKLMKNAKKIVTDSGGIQKESYILKVPCISLFTVTTWPETTNDGWNTLSEIDTEKIVNNVRNSRPADRYSNYFGQGACKKIAEIIRQQLLKSNYGIK